MPKTRALGTTISYKPTQASLDDPIFVGSLTSIGEVKPDSEELDATTLDSVGGYREYLQGFKNSGEVPLTGYQNAADAGQELCRTLYASGALGYWVITFPDTPATVVSFTAYLKSYAAGAADVDGIVGFGAALRVSGAVGVA
jgi:predicted secreted protein